MRLINVRTYILEEFFNEQVPPYAILSHTWGRDQDEVSFRDITERSAERASANHWPIKLSGCCEQAAKDGLEYVWIDTCCIDKDNSVELGEAINSMFRWYREAKTCYVYLSDVTDESHMESGFSGSRWFTRGWTLQELLAPRDVQFYNSTWKLLGNKTDTEILRPIEKVTGIPRLFLRGEALTNASIAQRMSWASGRTTKRKEDIAYCLLGIFDITMPMILGEGDRAFIRLQEKLIKRTTRDASIFAWGLPSETSAPAYFEDITSAGIFASSPADFANSSRISRNREIKSRATFVVDGGCVRSEIPLYRDPTGQLFGLLNCGLLSNNNGSKVVGIPLVEDPSGEYIRPRGHYPQLFPESEVTTISQIYIKTERDQKTTTVSSYSNCFEIENLGEPGLKLIEVEPQDCWREKESLIITSNHCPGSDLKQYWLRFRLEDEGSTDFIVLLELQIPGSQRKAQCHIMTSSQFTPLKDLARYSSNMRPTAFGHNVARGNLRSISVTMDQDTTAGECMFVVKVAETTTLPTVTVNATFELELQAAKSERKKAAKEKNELYLEIEKFNQQRGTAYTLECVEERFAEIREEQIQLETIKEWRTELSKKELSIERKFDDYKRTALANNYDPVLIAEISTAKGELVTCSTFTGFSGLVLNVAFSPDGRVLATASNDGIFRLWEVATGGLHSIFRGYSGLVLNMAFSPDGRVLATASNDGIVRLWEVITGRLYSTLIAHSGSVLNMAFSPDGRVLATASNDKTIRLWDMATEVLQSPLTGHSDLVLTMAFPPDGRALASASNDGTVRLWQMATIAIGGPHSGLTGYFDLVLNVAFSPDGRVLATASSDGTIKLWEVLTGGLHSIFRGYSGLVLNMAFSPDGRVLASASNDGIVRLWEIATGGLYRILTGHSDSVLNVVFSPDGTALASASKDGTVRLWEVAGGF